MGSRTNGKARVMLSPNCTSSAKATPGGDGRDACSTWGATPWQEDERAGEHRQHD